MAIALNNTTNSNTTDNVASKTWSHTVGSGANRLLIVAFSYNPNNDSETISTVTYGGVSMTSMTAITGGLGSGTGRCVQIWYLKNPTSGAANIVATFSSTSITVYGGAIDLSGVDQTTTFGTQGSSTGTSGTSGSVTRTTTVGSKQFSVASLRTTNSSGTVTTPTTALWNILFTGSNNYAAAALQDCTTTSTVSSYSWTTSSNRGIAAIEILAAAGSPVTKDQSAVARIAKNVTKTQPAIAHIATNPTKTQSAISRVSNSRNKTQTAIARLSRTLNSTQPAIARIIGNLKTQSAIARLVATVNKTQPAVSRISNSRNLTQSAISHISITGTKTQPALARIQKNQTKTQTAVARVYQPIPLSKTQPAIARLVNTRFATISARARIITTGGVTPPADTTVSLVPAEVLAAILTSGTNVVRRVEIYESDGVTPWLMAPDLVDGSVSVSNSRVERRAFDLTLGNSDGALNNYPGGFWYDKIIKVFRGVRYGVDKTIWEKQIGEFMIDNITTQNFPKTVSINGRDYMKKLIVSKFPLTTTFSSGASLEATIKTIALNGGVTKFNLAVTGKTLGKDFTWDAGTERQQAINDLADAYGYEIFFDAQGYLVLREQRDPVVSPEIANFLTGGANGNLATYKKASSDAQIYNHVVVTGDSSQTVPVSAQAINNAPTSPTRVDKIGDRVYQYSSSFITTAPQAQDVANKFLAVHALEAFEMDMESLVLPWLEVNEVVRFTDPAPNPGDPNRYLLTDFTIPMALGAMSATGKRITIVG